MAGNDLRASEGRETKALNCKPNTNLKEISELSNYCKTSGFRLHAVIFSSTHSVLQNTNCSHILLMSLLLKQSVRHQLKIPILLNGYHAMVRQLRIVKSLLAG